MSSSAKLSVVLPVRNGRHQIARKIQLILEAMREMTGDAVEIVVVDDGSGDGTGDMLEEIARLHSEVRVARHDRPRGMEAAGQTGLERATGELVFIQESEAELSLTNLIRLAKLSQDDSVVAARAESAPPRISGELVRRLRAWGTAADRQLGPFTERNRVSSMQLIRRPHLQKLAGPGGHRYRLEASTYRESGNEPTVS